MTPTPSPFVQGPYAPAAGRALVTGGSSGIGRDIALMLASAGVRTYVVGRRAAKLDSVVAEAPAGTVVPLAADIRDADAVAAAFDAAEADGGPVPLLVNAASGAFLAAAEDISPNGFAAVVGSSLTGPFTVLRRWARPLLDSGTAGCATMVSSALAEREVPGAAHSSAAKAGLEALIRSLAVEWGPRGLRVNSLAPGAFSTEGADAGMWSDDAVRTAALSNIPLGRFGTSDELLGAAAFLLSRAATYVTGATIVVDGGWHLSSHPFGDTFPSRT
ncbi:SDR family oxidoreductase [Euzebya sp.]|uniref:SDR family oxidoreductase n=1 Tax=Euzebya sp. TaxID=1971409 RepID=UPI003511F2A4